jgi:hypothetical protein
MLSTSELFAFEAAWVVGRHTGNKEVAIRRDLGIAPARYYQLLNRAIETHEGLKSDPQLVHTLLRRRDEHRARRRR